MTFVRAALALTLLLVPAMGLAKVFKCPVAGGGHEYRQVPCDTLDGGEITVVDPTVPRRSASAPESADAAALRGDWCEFAVSTTVDSEKALDNIHWYFGADYITYVHSRALKPAGVQPPRYPLRRSGASFFVDDPMFGGARAQWDVVGRQSGVMLVEGPFGGILHMRPGRC